MQNAAAFAATPSSGGAMPTRNWRSFRPTSLREALEGCKDYALEKHRRGVERIAELMGEESHWTVYGWLRDGSIPGKKIVSYQHACGCDFLTRYYAHSAAMLLIPIPQGRAVQLDDMHRLQGTLNGAVAALVRFAAGDIEAAEAGHEITTAMEALAWHRENTARTTQPELDL